MSTPEIDQYISSVARVLSDVGQLAIAARAVLAIRNLPDNQFVRISEQRIIAHWRQVGRWLGIRGQSENLTVTVPPALDLLCQATLKPIAIDDCDYWTAGAAAIALAEWLHGEIYNYMLGGEADVPRGRRRVEDDILATLKLFRRLARRSIKEAAIAAREHVPAVSTEMSTTDFAKVVGYAKSWVTSNKDKIGPLTLENAQLWKKDGRRQRSEKPEDPAKIEAALAAVERPKRRV